MDSLDNLNEIADLDKGNILGSIEALPRQISQAWKEVNELIIPHDYKKATNIVVSGMGGSALGGRVLESLLYSTLSVPFEVFPDFHLPEYIDDNTLVVSSSYSGNTEETISSYHHALNKKAMVFVITTGGKLADFAKKDNLPCYIYNPIENPSGKPRMAIGYSIASILAILSKLSFTTIKENNINDLLKLAEKIQEHFGVRTPENDNLAKSIARKFKSKTPVIVSSMHLLGASHAFKNYLNENSKTFGLIFDLPELNHHLMEGLRNPAIVRENLFFLFIESSLYGSEIQKRYPLTRDVVEKNEIEIGVLNVTEESRLGQVYEVLAFGLYVSFYLAMLYDIDPSPIPWVDYFKVELAKR